MKLFSKQIKFFLTALTLISVMSFAVSAQTLTEIDSQIQKANAEKAARQKDLSNAQSLLKSLQNQSYSVSTNITTLQNQIQDIVNKNTQVTQQIADLEKNITDTQSELDQQKALRDKEIKDYYVDTYSNNTLEVMLSQNVGFEQFQVLNAVKSYTLRDKKTQLDDLSQRYQDLNTERQQVQDLKKSLEDQNNQLAQKKNEMQTQLASLNNNIASTSTNASNIKSQLSTIQNNLGYLSATRQKELNAELAAIAQNQQVTQTPIQDGQYFFLGRGRDLIEGHGMGMSQWGAYGEAKNFGWTYDQILKYYYTGVTIGDYAEPDQIIVDGKTNGPIPFEDYIAGIGEVPNDWPVEAIKAQVVAARTYAMRSAYKDSNGIYHICGTDACQVYVGGTAKKEYADATKGKVILYGGSPIVAYYSASHRGCSSTLSTVWGSTDLPYIKSVNDDAYAYKDYKSANPYPPYQLIPTYNWQWRTNGYSLDQLSTIFSKSTSLNVGNVQSITTAKDNCGRVATITLKGSSGTKTLTGWDFRSIYNSVTPYSDYIYSTEFSFGQK